MRHRHQESFAPVESLSKRLEEDDDDSKAVPAEDLLPNYSSWASRTMKSKRPQEIIRQVKDFILQKKRIPPSKDGRHIPVQVLCESPLLIDERTNKPYCSNLITSSIYTPYTFLPRQLFAQFSKLANIYFLFVSILQMIPSWSTTGTYTTIIPLMVFVAISMGREGFDDWRRHRQDKNENNRPAKVAVLDSASNTVRYETKAWQDIKVGDIVRLDQDDWVPADIVMLQSSGEENIAYIETMALDGETNLKQREPLPELARLCASPSDMATKLNDSDVEIVSEDPNLDLYNFEATAHINGTSYPLSTSHIVYRGSIIRNTAKVHGLVIFSGEESKIRMNSIQNARTKAPRLQKRVNRIVIFMVCFVLLLAAFCTVASRIYYNTTGSNMWYLVGLEVGIVPNLMGFIIMLNTLIPLSLYVSMEIIKVCQMLILQQDVDMYHPESNTRCEARTATINEELGQVSYIFSDKTGTLTDNVMIFRKLSVAGYAWIHDLDIQLANEDTSTKLFHKAQITNLTSDSKGKGRVNALRQGHGAEHHESKPRPSVDDIFHQVAALPRKSGLSIGQRPSMASIGKSSVRTWKSTANPAKVQNSWSTLQLLQYMQLNPNSLYTKRAKFFLLSIALCHSCLPETKASREARENSAEPGSDNEDGTIDLSNDDLTDLEYHSASPDESALVSAARDLGYIVTDRQHKSLTLRTFPNGFDEDPVDEVYEVLETIEFSSARKRMSVVTKFPDGRIVVFTKGADNVILERLRQSELAMKKAEELNEQAAMRKAAESEYVIARNSMSSTAPPRLSGFSGGRPSINIDRRQALATLDSHFQRAHHDEVEDIAEASRRSMSLAQQQNAGRASGGRASTETGLKTRSSMEFARKSIDQALENPEVIALDGNNPPKEEVSIDDHVVVSDDSVIQRTLEHIEEFSTEGLRTLLYGYRWMDKDEYDQWIKLYKDARVSLVDRQEKVEKVGEMIEKNLDLCGATAIEDKLQEGVPEAIEKLRRANIRLWMLTGDKRETAINIGYSCRLIKDYSTVVILRSDEGDVAGKMAAAMLSLEGGKVAHCVVVVDGQTLGHIEEDMTLMSLFIELGVKADSVICCRASPAQKASMVKAVRKKVASSVTLAIGDGANDIAMIQSADVGVGITGKEGLQAARSSDFSLAQFRFLLKLLLVHGRWNYVRICKYILGTFYKEFFFYLTQVIYQSNTMFTGTSMYENWSLSMFNTLFTSLPVLCVGIFDRDMSPATLLAVPELYAKGQQNQGFNIMLFIGWMFVASGQSLMVSFMVYYLYGFDALKDNTIYPLSTLSFSIILIVICTKLQILEMYTISIANVLAMVISIGGWFVWDMFLSYVYQQSPSMIYFVYDGLFQRFGRDLSWWTTMLVTFSSALVFDLLIQTVRLQFYATDSETFQQIEHDPAIRRKLEQEAAYELQLSNEGRSLQSIYGPPEDLEATPSRGLESYHDNFSTHSMRVSSHSDVSSTEHPLRKRDKIKKKLRFSRKTSGEYEREIEEILERREMEMDEMKPHNQ